MNTYTFHFDIYGLAFLGVSLIGLCYALQVGFTKKEGRGANRFLSLALGLTMLGLVWDLYRDISLGSDFPRWSWLSLNFSLVTGSLIFFYVLKTTSPQYPFRWKDLLHFSPLLLEMGALILQINESRKTGKPTCDTLIFQQWNPIHQILVFLSVAIYLLLCRKLIGSYYQRMNFIAGDRYRHEFQWLNRMLRNFAFLWLLWIPFTVADHFYYHHSIGGRSGYPLYLFFAVVFIRNVIVICLRPGVSRPVEKAPSQYVLIPKELKQRSAWLKSAMKVNRYYEDPDLSLNSLACKIKLHPHELSRIINTALKKNFNDFVNEYRVQAAARRMQDPTYDHLTLLGIAYESGFNSQSTFNRIFKQLTGKSPVEYKNAIKIEFPTYDLGSRRPPAPLILNQETTPRWSPADKIKRNPMFKNHFKTSWRNLKKNKAYSILNIAGLAVGTVCAALIFLWVEDELTFNHNFAKRDYLYHVMQNEKSDAGINTNGSTPGPLAAALKADVPGIVNSGRLSWAMDELVVSGEKLIKENGMYADPSILAMYDLPFIYGDRATALSHPKDVVISETMSRKFFGDRNPVGKMIKMNAQGAYSVDGLYTVSGVFKDLPANCYYHFQWLSPYTTWEDANTWLKPWGNNLTETIVQLSPSTHPAEVNKVLKSYLSTKVDKAVNQCFLFSMNDWHLRSNFVNGVQDGGAIKYVKLFSMIAVIILLIACINFMNLSTARSEQRMKEVGVLKVMGANKISLIGKFISESVLLSFISMLCAVVLLYLLIPFYNDLVQKELAVNLFDPLHFGGLLAIGLVAGLIAGSYPAFYLSSFNPVSVLKGMKIKNSINVVFIRKGLVVTQFAASVMLIVATIVVYKQVQHIRDRNIGYSKNNLIYMDIQGNMKAHFSTIKNSLMATGYVENAATSLHDALHVYSAGDGFTWQGKNPNAKLPIHSNVVSAEYLKTMQMKLVSGRDFYAGTTDSSSVIINESMAGTMGKEGKVGSIIHAGRHVLTVVGIIKDFVYNDIYGGSAPLILLNSNNGPTVMAVRFKPNADLSQALAKTADVMNKENAGFSFEYRFADEDFDKLFSNETLIGKLAGLFAMLAIFISCLGLFGLAAYTAERRAKEIGIRKVLGASVTGLMALLAKEFLQLVTLSCVIAFPVAWLFMHNWLQNYAYRTAIEWWMFALPAFSALLVALITVSFQAINAAVANPIKSLRSE
ncbi:ABC transporter permease [Mucilaginibacter pocheonensis]|uniref:ABC-type antimicrobial peptide transport system permease subunit/AraC-like DNA-binding protein n=1 Tax=Mucilaginibacter pocheonensis TaxID=398050 RepID=A0ABU1TC03_9SPHI|nr:ABC transporter permease [Mucilaginibacter pocheonensis]MDR6942927.1 ABC-type antimicrobial peptide transport system permease subunit/AraC-like DNA-binding protein [Mucilaginibacter pocheonensis]